MPPTAIVLLFISASLHALWNLLLKRSQEKYIAMGWQVILSGVFALILLLFIGLPPRSMWLFALISMSLEAVYFILLSSAYTSNDFSLVYPIARGTAPAFLMAWSVLFLREQLTAGGSDRHHHDRVRDDRHRRDQPDPGAREPHPHQRDRHRADWSP
jgi:multidrug transporter EmrE-like cation transporter